MSLLYFHPYVTTTCNIQVVNACKLEKNVGAQPQRKRATFVKYEDIAVFHFLPYYCSSLF